MFERFSSAISCNVFVSFTMMRLYGQDCSASVCNVIIHPAEGDRSTHKIIIYCTQALEIFLKCVQVGCMYTQKDQMSLFMWDCKAFLLFIEEISSVSAFVSLL